MKSCWHRPRLDPITLHYNSYVGCTSGYMQTFLCMCLEICFARSIILLPVCCLRLCSQHYFAPLGARWGGGCKHFLTQAVLGKEYTNSHNNTKCLTKKSADSHHRQSVSCSDCGLCQSNIRQKQIDLCT